MRRPRFLLAIAACLGAASSGCGGGTARDELVARAARPIQGGTVDTGDPAVVGIVVDVGGGLSICTGVLIAPNLVLTANHCVSQPTSSSTGCSASSFGAQRGTGAFRITASYDAAAGAYGTGTVPPVDSATWFGVLNVTVAGADLCGQDLAVLELSKPMIGVCPLIPRVDSAVASGEGYTAVGFGITSPTAAAAGTRYQVTGLSVQCAADCGIDTSATLEWIGGASTAKGACDGDSGGPALDAAGRVIGTVSRGPASSCSPTVYEGAFGAAAWLKRVALQAAADGGYAAAGWVTGGATADPDNGYCGAGSEAGVPDAGATDAGDGSSGAPDAGADDALGEDGGAGADALDVVDAGARDGRGGRDRVDATADCAVVGPVGAVAPSVAGLLLPALALAMAARARRRGA